MSNIASIVPCGSGQTYDLEVDHPDHQFYLSNGALTSNSHAISYAMDSFFCAWLMTYHETEWLCAYLESMSTNDVNRAKAFSEVRALGYKIAPIDVNYASRGWSALPGKRFMPSFTSCKGVGDVGVDELIRFRPFRSIEEMLWDNTGKWRLSKFNKRCLESLIKVGGFDSMDIVGPDRMFSSYRHMHEVLIVNNAELKKSTKREPFKGQKRFYELVKELRGVRPWSREQQIKHQVEHFGSVDINRLVPDEVMTRLTEKGIPSIDQHDDDAPRSCWFVISSATRRTTKNGSPYLLLSALADGGKEHKVYLWRWDGVTRFKSYELVVAVLELGAYGFSTSQRDLAVIDIDPGTDEGGDPDACDEEDDDVTSAG